jgi:hypothetical protein
MFALASLALIGTSFLLLTETLIILKIVSKATERR